MISYQEFDELCSSFYKKYAISKKNTIQIEKLSTLLAIPIVESMSINSDLACRKACSHCCFLRVACFPHEAIGIYLYLHRTQTKLKIKQIKEKIKHQYTIIKNLSEEEHYTTNIECPLLEDNICLTYPVRPISCAGYHSLSEEKCKYSNDNPNITDTQEASIPQIHSINEQIAIQNSIMVAIGQRTGEDVNRRELIYSLHNLFKNPGLIQQWKNTGKFIKDS